MVRTKSKPEEPIRSVKEFRRKYLPRSYQKELERQEDKDGDPAGTGLISELLEGIRRGLAAQKKRDQHRA